MTQKTISLLGSLQAVVDQVTREMKSAQVFKRIWEHDASLWKTDANHTKVIKNRLGWLNSVEWLVQKQDELEAFQNEILKSGFTHAVLLGMGGSSLAPEVLRQTFGSAPQYPKFILCDSTNSDQVLAVERAVKLETTLFIVSSKSGTTLESASFYHYFYDKMKVKKGERAGENFIAITDGSTVLEEEAKTKKFRRAFINPTNIGGRFSVLSYFGMVPAAILGLNVKELIGRLELEVKTSVSEAESSAGFQLGVLMAEAAKKGRDKVTIVMAKAVESYGLWIEQLIAESLGKEGKGIVPIFGEPLKSSVAYENDRLFVLLHCGPRERNIEEAAEKLSQAGHPVVHIDLVDSYDLGRQFYRWALATAVAGIPLAINPFDEPNVQEAKDWAKALLNELGKNGKFPEVKSHFEGKSFCLNFDKQSATKAVGSSPKSFLGLLKSGDYINIAAYLPYSSETEQVIARLRSYLAKETKRATMFGFGPRYLHSTGQLHKGGPNNCLMIMITSDFAEDAKIPGQSFTFGQLEYAQAVGDFNALEAKGRRVLRFHIQQPIKSSLQEVVGWFGA